MIELDTLYLRFADSIAINEHLIIKGIKEAKELSAKNIKFFGNSTRDKELFKRLVKQIVALNMAVEIDINITDIDLELVEFIKEHAASVKFGLNITPPYNLNDININCKGLLVNININNNNINFIPDIIDSYIYKHGFRRVKLYFNLHSLDYDKYQNLVKYILQHYSEYGDKLYTAIPYVFLEQRNLKLARRVCNYHKVVGLFTDGVITACGIKRSRSDESYNLKQKSLLQIITSHEKIIKLHQMKPSDLVGVCKICVFKNYCGNICPAAVYNHSGAFNKSFRDCQLLYDKGLFPNEYLTV
ncbi:hypothetical protein IMX26_14245 [Clostridium sp. 'deep sea']|uniref:hypothetical protein n=1 Tax=Clostridium sp. 'deep sea' TaxID=2779445 RepID=UPI0018968BF0|nr:hypothetical protein [Clostridium sp. 'deep sea']QOR34620.1 hypothetical protein IMX26_14245 [Clostridium sp. 'deep sea']